jgi:Mn2+/Fe2+ NRAMP family transporter
MKKILEVTLGIVTSVGGFLEIGSIATAAQAGAAFGYQLIWAVVLGTVCIAVLVEMSGRFAAVSEHTIPDAMRERFGATFFALPFVVMLGVSFLVLTAEMGGVAVALEMATGVRFPWWALPAALVSWALLWKGSFGLIEKGVSILGLITIAFAVGAMDLHPDYGAIARGALPSRPSSDAAKYWFTTVSILGASISPYLYYFYCSGAIEEKWDESYLATNRVIAAFGMAFGGFLSIAIVVLAALIFKPASIQADHYDQLPLLLLAPFGKAGFWLFVASLGIACLGATLEITLSLAYFVAQGLGWNWGKDMAPARDARFSLCFTLFIVLAIPVVLAGVDPLKITMLAMALTATALPLGTFPFLILMNDKAYLGDHTNKPLGNAVVLLISIMATVLGVVSIPLQIMGG